MHTKAFLDNRTIALLRRARRLIASPEHWTIDTIARRRDGTRCLAVGDRAAQWCAVGAIAHEANPNLPGVAAQARMELASVITPTSGTPNGRVIAHFNDHHRHEDVLAMFDRAIQHAKGAAARSRHATR